jgi:RHS repeat-associated protein
MGPSRCVASRSVNLNDGVTPAQTWTYAWSAGSLHTLNIETSPADSSGVQNDVVHTIDTNGFDIEEQFFAGPYTNNVLLKTVNNVYEEDINPFADYGGSGTINGVLLSATTSWPNGQSSTTATTYDTGFTSAIDNLSLLALGEVGTTSYNVLYGSPVLKQEYDYGATTPTKQVATSYEWQINSNYQNANLLNLPASVVTEDGSGNRFAETDYNYDEPTYLTASGISLQAAPPNGAYRGHATTVTHWLNTGNNSPTSHINWYDTGEVYQQVDPKTNTTTYAYSSAYGGSLPTTVTNALGQSSSYSYDFNTGKMTSKTDPNGQTRTYAYVDSLGRLTNVSYPDGGGESFQYSDTGTIGVTATQQINSSLNKQTQYNVDGLGRLYLTSLLTDPDGIAYTRISYDNLGRTYQEWNPTRCNPMTATSCLAESTWGITTYNYDALNRKTKQIDSDGFSTQTWNYTGNVVAYTDEDGNQWQRTTDALGRLTQVVEPGNLVTAYTYNPLDDLLNVNQQGNTSNGDTPRVRNFVYDSLSRLTNSCNPETLPSGSSCGGSTWSETYGYDADNNLSTKTDARNITINYTYDALNRLTDKTYTEPPSLPAGYTHTDPVHYGYDQSSFNGVGMANTIGRRSSMTDNSGSNAGWTTFSYDVMGRANYLVKQILTVTPPYDQQNWAHWSVRSYDLAGNVIWHSPYTGTTFGYTYDGAGHANSATWYDGGGTPHSFVTNTVYDPAGHLASDLLGYGPTDPSFGGSSTQQVSLSNNYNSRLQPALVQASIPSQTLLSRSYCYYNCPGASATNGNSGNILSVTDNAHFNPVTLMPDTRWSHVYSYDGLNRLQTADATAYSYDSFGNKAPDPLSLPSNVTQWSTYTAQNQAPANGGLVYDNAGNVITDQISDPGVTNSFTYDAEGRLATLNGGVQNGGVTYVYDGDGNRVATLGTAQGGTRYWSWADGTETDETYYTGWPTRLGYFDGELVLGGQYSPEYYLHDHLGSKSVTVSLTGTVEDDIDYLPFGGMASYSTNTSPDPHKFTGKQRDTETNLDYFGARYYSSTAGRWMSPDWSVKAEPVPYAKMDDPQSLNLYAYVGNNPLAKTDPTGHDDFGYGGYGITKAKEIKQMNDKEQVRHDTDQQTIKTQMAQQTNAQSQTAAQKQNGQQGQQNQTSSAGHPIDKDAIVNYADQHAAKGSLRECATYCRKAFEAGGVDTKGHPIDAKDWGPTLLKNGAAVVSQDGYTPQKADVAVFAGNDAHPSGHITIYDGKQWVSDFKQRNMSPYGTSTPPVTIYRFPDN